MPNELTPAQEAARVMREIMDRHGPALREALVLLSDGANERQEHTADGPAV